MAFLTIHHFTPQAMILDSRITIYDGYSDNQGHPGTLGDFIRLCIAHKNDVYRLRDTNDVTVRRHIKSHLPAAAISGVFAPTRSVKNLQEHSGLICIDIDHVDDTATLMHTLANMDIVAYCSRSVSGHGVFGIIPLAYPDKHKQQFEALRRDFVNMDIELDKNCSDVTRLRGLSYDREAVIRLNAVPYRGVYTEPRETYIPRRYYPTTDRTIEHVETCVNIILKNRVDITDGYNNWLIVGFSLASLGECGRDYFHAVSSIYPKYNRTETDRKFDNLVRVSNDSIASFFKICADHGVTFKNEHDIR